MSFRELYQQANQLFSQRQYDDALRIYSDCLAYQPDNPLVYVYRANCYVFLEQKGLALADYQKAIDLDPKEIISYYNRAICYRKYEDMALAINDLDQCLTIDPLNQAALLNRGSYHLRQQNYQEAIQDFEFLIKLNKESVLAYHNLSVAYKKTGQFQLAAHYLAEAEQRVEIKQRS